jgi:uncharacterized protein
LGRNKCRISGTSFTAIAFKDQFRIRRYKMRNKTLPVSILILIAVLLSACASTGVQATQPAPRTLSVTGSAQASLTPDIAYVNIGVHSENPNASEAVAANNATTQAVAEALKALGVDSKDILTTNFSIYPQDEWGPDGIKTGTKFVVDNTVYVTLRDLTKIGDILNAAVLAGANTINGIQFDVADKTAVLAQARTAAVENAKLQAQELAKAAGVELSEVQSLSYYNSYAAPLPLDNKGIGGGGSAAASVPISAGQLTVTVEVSMTYAIK